MLVLRRKQGEPIVVPSLNVVITVVAIGGGKVRLGISAPEEVAVYREEIWSRIRESPSRQVVRPRPNPKAAQGGVT